MGFFPDRLYRTRLILLGWGLPLYFFQKGVRGLFNQRCEFPSIGRGSGSPIIVEGPLAIKVALTWICVAVLINLYCYWYESHGGAPWMEFSLRLFGILSATGLIYGFIMVVANP
jgi:hypothetical protein